MESRLVFDDLRPFRYLLFEEALLSTLVRSLSLAFCLVLVACSGGGAKRLSEPGGSGGDNDLDAGEGPRRPDGGNQGTDRDARVLPTCADLLCPVGQACRELGEGPACVAATCAELSCSATEVCRTLASGDGSYCADNRCANELDCNEGEHCTSGGICAKDECVPGQARCVGQSVERCAADGSKFEVTMTCGSAGAFASSCHEAGADTYCSCEGDWDCPSFTACVVGRCEGTGKAPKCTLAPSSFADAKPSPEYGTRGAHWGGKSVADVNATAGTPFPDSTQVVMTPVVGNLSDDNGDGVINERDFPEIVFLTFCKAGADRISNHGILRAIHGGGPRKGEDLFAACGKNLTWHDGNATDAASSAACACPASPADLDPTAGVAIGDLDGEGKPEIVAVTHDNKLRIFDATGRFIAESGFVGAEDVNRSLGNGSPAIANVDQKGLAEIVLGSAVATLRKVPAPSGTGEILAFDQIFEGGKAKGSNGQGPISCVADVNSAKGLEIVAGASVYRLPSAPTMAEIGRVVKSPSDCNATDVPNLVDDVRERELRSYCENQLALVWDAIEENNKTLGDNNKTLADNEGFCAVADVWGSQQGTNGKDAPRPGPLNPLDGEPEVVLVSDGQIQIYNGQTGKLIFIDNSLYDVNATSAEGFGGAPNVDDFDGDGFPEIGTAASTYYAMIDLQTPSTSCPAWPGVWPTLTLDGNQTGPNPVANGPRMPPAMTCDSDDDCAAFGAEFACNEAASTCVCLHNGWRRRTQDDSSRVTGSSLFDFNGDGTAEVVYNDECFFRVYNGVNGIELFRDSSESRTRTENPVIADVDNDGNAEIVFGTSTESGFCKDDNTTRFRDAANYRPGLEVWGDAADRWVSARRIYNQHAYHVTNVLEGGGVPTTEPASWLSLNGRTYNSYRSQPRTGVGILAPNLVASALQISSPGAGCGEVASNNAQITVLIENRGDLRVGPGVRVGFYGKWDSPSYEGALLDANGTALGVTLTSSLEPGAQTIVSVAYSSTSNQRAELPDQLRAVVDDAAVERECIETDNEATLKPRDVIAAPRADLTVKLALGNGSCAAERFDVTVTNTGTKTADKVSYTLYIGDPAAGGGPLTTVTLSDPLEPGQSVSRTTEVPSFPARDVRVYVLVDPQDRVAECNDANNVASLDVFCAPPDVL